MDQNDPAPTGHGAQREIDADQREAALDAREDSIRSRETASADLKQETQDTLDEAAERDQDAQARDSVADDRDRAASLDAFLHGEDLRPGLQARRSAGMDRSDSKADRASAADDRAKLTGHGRIHPDAQDDTNPAV